MILQWERIHNDPCLLYFKYNLLLSLCFKYHLLLSLCFKYHLLLSLCFKYHLLLSLCFKYLYSFHYAFNAFTMWTICYFLSRHLHYLLRYCEYYPLCDLSMKILIGL